MKLAMQYLNDVEGIGMTQSLSFVFFFTIFLLILYYVVTTKKSYYDPISDMPLGDDAEEYPNNEVV